MPHGSPRIRLANGRMNLIGSRLKRGRLDARITQDKLCGQLAYITEGAWVPTRHDIYRIEAGIRTVSDAEIISLAGVLGCSLVWLICGMETEPLSMNDWASQTFRGAKPALEASTKADQERNS